MEGCCPFKIQQKLFAKSKETAENNFIKQSLSLPKIKLPKSSPDDPKKISTPSKTQTIYSQLISNISNNTPKKQKSKALLPTLHESFDLKGKTAKTSDEKQLKLDKFIIKYAKPTKSFSSQRKTVDESLKKSSKPSNFSSKSSEIKCPFEFFATKSKLSEENSKDFSLEKVSHFLNQANFAYIIMDFEQKVTKVPQLAKYFEKVDKKQIFQGKMEFFRKNYGFMHKKNSAAIFLQMVHQKMQLSHEDFNTFKGFFSIVLREHEVDEEIIADFLNFIESFRKFVVSDRSILQIALEEVFDFEQILIAKFNEKINNNHIINHYFLNKDASFQINHCKSVINYLVKGDPSDNNYKELLRDCHKDCLVNDHIFYHFKQCFLLSLREIKKKNIQEDMISSNSIEKKTGFHAENLCFFNETHVFDIGDMLENLRLSVLNQKSFYEIFKENGDFDKMAEFFTVLLIKTPILKQLFRNFSVERVKKHTIILLEFLLSGPSKYNKNDLTPAHYNLKINLEHFKKMREILDLTLRKFKVCENNRIYILCDLDYYKYNLCNEMPLLRKIGGEKNISYIVNSFYLKAFQNPNLRNFFSSTDIVSMVNNQKNWFCKLFDNYGMKSYNFKDLRCFHFGMGITEEAFQFFVQNFVEGFKELEIRDEIIVGQAIEMISRAKNDVLDLKNE